MSTSRSIPSRSIPSPPRCERCALNEHLVSKAYGSQVEVHTLAPKVVRGQALEAHLDHGDPPHIVGFPDPHRVGLQRRTGALNHLASGEVELHLVHRASDVGALALHHVLDVADFALAELPALVWTMRIRGEEATLEAEEGQVVPLHACQPARSVGHLQQRRGVHRARHPLVRVRGKARQQATSLCGLRCRRPGRAVAGMALQGVFGSLLGTGLDCPLNNFLELLVPFNTVWDVVGVQTGGAPEAARALFPHGLALHLHCGAPMDSPWC
mmetsp:Transcript_132068/g.295478  ORF Transcript_132068/g.295478 Transcript_132068/m.295478 type:complete len:269 (-) Transcript_132068:90-896(-)